MLTNLCFEKERLCLRLTSLNVSNLLRSGTPELWLFFAAIRKIEVLILSFVFSGIKQMLYWQLLLSAVIKFYRKFR